MNVAAGTVLEPGLVLVRPLGQGAMGSVWAATSERYRGNVAVKIIAKSVARDRAGLVRFQREAAAAARIDCPHVVRVFGTGETADDTPFIVMELLEGESLGSVIERAGRLDPAVAAQIVRQIATALDAAHSVGLIHRDIKPDNVFLSGALERPFVKLVDFGMAKATSRRTINPNKDDSMITGTGMLVGTPDYMSPEQALGSKDVTLKSDLWALAAVAYRILTGRLPFDGETPHALFFRLCRGAFHELTEHGFPGELDAFFRRAFSPKPEGRFATGAELSRAFDDVVAVARDSFFDARITSRFDESRAGDDSDALPHAISGERLANASSGLRGDERAVAQVAALAMGSSAALPHSIFDDAGGLHEEVRTQVLSLELAEASSLAPSSGIFDEDSGGAPTKARPAAVARVVARVEYERQVATSSAVDTGAFLESMLDEILKKPAPLDVTVPLGTSVPEAALAPDPADSSRALASPLALGVEPPPEMARAATARKSTSARSLRVALALVMVALAAALLAGAALLRG